MVYGGQGLYMFDKKKENNVLVDIIVIRIELNYI